MADAANPAFKNGREKANGDDEVFCAADGDERMIVPRCRFEAPILINNLRPPGAALTEAFATAISRTIDSSDCRGD